jgi:hypothetical protein
MELGKEIFESLKQDFMDEDVLHTIASMMSDAYNVVQK